MKSEKYDKMKGLVSRIDDFSRSADLVSEVLESVKANGGVAKIHTHTGGRNYETELSSETLKIVFADVLKAYHALIREAQKEMNSIIESTIANVE